MGNTKISADGLSDTVFLVTFVDAPVFGQHTTLRNDNKKLLMKIITTIAALLISASAFSSTPHKYRLVWEDHFNGSTYDSSTWSKIPRGKADWKRHKSEADSLYAVRDGKLILRGAVNTNPSADTARYVTGGLYTRYKRTIAYGKVEVRAMFGSAQGAWPAIWMLPDRDIKWPEGGEIDIMEHLNHDTIAYQTVHSYYTHTLKKDQNPPHGSTLPIDRDGFNTYAVEILPDSLVFSINGRTSFAYPRIETTDKGQYPFGEPFYLLVDMQIEGSWVGKADPKQLPVEMEVDWVKFYELDNEPGNNHPLPAD